MSHAPRIPIPLALALFLSAPAPAAGSGEPPSVVLPYAAGEFDLEGDVLAFTVDEAGQGADLNGDGDALDRVLHVARSASDVRNLRIAVYDSHPDPMLAVAGTRVVFGAREAAQGATDLNGDGDSGDWVLFVYDTEDESLTNLGLAAQDFAATETHLLFPVLEARQGGTDLDGDGDAVDAVAHVWDYGALPPVNLGLAVGGLFSGPGATYRLDGSRVFLRVSELQQNADLNGDGDALDFVLHAGVGSQVANVGLPTPNLLFAPSFAGWLVFGVPELEHGGADLNGDGDALDSIGHVHHPVAGLTLPLGLDLSSASAGGGQLVFEASEADVGIDANGDGDLADDFLRALDLGSGTLATAGIASSGYEAGVGGVAITVAEWEEGAMDLNGDGDASDLVLHAYRHATGAAVALAQSPGYDLAGRHLLFREHEQAAGADLNGDGDAQDLVLQRYDLVSGVVTNYGLAIDPDGIDGASVAVQGERAVVAVDEAAQGGADLNGDGGATARVLHVVDLVTDEVTNLGLEIAQVAGHLVQAGDGLVAVSTYEYALGQDANGDGDLGDSALVVVTE